jgi:hypothetical protein
VSNNKKVKDKKAVTTGGVYRYCNVPTSHQCSRFSFRGSAPTKSLACSDSGSSTLVEGDSRVQAKGNHPQTIGRWQSAHFGAPMPFSIHRFRLLCMQLQFGSRGERHVLPTAVRSGSLVGRGSGVGDAWASSPKGHHAHQKSFGTRGTTGGGRRSLLVIAISRRGGIRPLALQRWWVFGFVSDFD